MGILHYSLLLFSFPNFVHIALHVWLVALLVSSISSRVPSVIPVCMCAFDKILSLKGDSNLAVIIGTVASRFFCV